MLYLEDYLEMIEHLPQELRDRFTEMRELDLQVQNSMDSLEKRVKIFFSNAKKMKPLDQEAEYEAIKKDYYKTLEDADEKVQLANHMYELVAKYLRRLDQETHKFKMELEADNMGITEILEKRSHEMDTLPTNSCQKENRYSFSSSQRISHHEKRRESSATSLDHKRLEKILPELRVPPTRELSGGGGGLVGVAPPHHHHHINSGGGGGGHHHHHHQQQQQQLHHHHQQQQQQQQAHQQSQLQSQLQAQLQSQVHQQSQLQSQAQGQAQVQAGTVPQVPYNLGHIGAGGTAIAAAASQAIAATQQMQQGRRTASLKASYEAIHSGGAGGGAGGGVGGVGGIGVGVGVAGGGAGGAGAVVVGSAEISISKELAGAAQTAIAAIQDTHKKHKKKSGVIASSALSVVGAGAAGGGGAVAAPSPVAPSPPDSVAAQSSASDRSSASNPDAYDPNEPRYCICNEVAFGTMVACDNKTCPYEWYHYPCVGITDRPKGKWYCPHCTSAMKRRNRKN